MPRDLIRIESMDQAIEILESSKHWTVKTVNRSGERRRFECTVWKSQRRVSASAFTPLEAVQAALAKLDDKFEDPEAEGEDGDHKEASPEDVVMGKIGPNLSPRRPA